MKPYKIGRILALLLALITVPMFILFEEMQFLILYNILLVGIALLILYFILVYIYLNFGKRIFTIFIIIILFIPLYLLSKDIYDDYTFKLKYEEWRDFSNAQELQISKDINMSYSDNGNDLLKYKTIIPQSGTLYITSKPDMSKNLSIKVFNSKPDKWIVSTPNENGIGVTVANVKKDETYFILIDQTQLNKRGRGTYIIKTGITK